MWAEIQELSEIASPGRCALGAFQAANLEQVQGILEAAVEERAPVIIAIDQPSALHAGLQAFRAMAAELMSEVPVPASIILERAQDLELIKAALECGFALSASPRAQMTKEFASRARELKDMAAEKGVFCEWCVDFDELGTDEFMDQKLPALEELDIKNISIAIPPEHRPAPPHGFFPSVISLASQRGFNVSLQGAGGWSTDNLREAVESGVWKISIGSRTNASFTRGLKEYLDANPDKISPGPYLRKAREAFRAEVRSCIRLFGASGTA